MTAQSGSNPAVDTGDLTGVDIGRFHLVERLGDSLAAPFYLGLSGDQSVWIEVLPAEVPDSAIQRLKDQRAAISKLKRARVPAVIEFGQDDRRTFVAAVRADGESLDQRIARGLGAIETVELIVWIAEALSETHALGISHGGLTARHLFFANRDGGEQLEILGFGLAGLRTGLEDQPNPVADIVAVGRIAYACLAGEDAHEDDPPYQVLRRQEYLPAVVRDLVLSLLEPDETLNTAAKVAAEATRLRQVLTTDIVPIKPQQPRDGQKIEVVLRTTVEAVTDESFGEDSLPGVEEAFYDRGSSEEGSKAPRSPLVERPPPKGIDGQTLMIAGAILLALILGLFAVTSSKDSSSGVVVESIEE